MIAFRFFFSNLNFIQNSTKIEQCFWKFGSGRLSPSASLNLWLHCKRNLETSWDQNFEQDEYWVSVVFTRPCYYLYCVKTRMSPLVLSWVAVVLRVLRNREWRPLWWGTLLQLLTETTTNGTGLECWGSFPLDWWICTTSTSVTTRSFPKRVSAGSGQWQEDKTVRNTCQYPPKTYHECSAWFCFCSVWVHFSKFMMVYFTVRSNVAQCFCNAESEFLPFFCYKHMKKQMKRTKWTFRLMMSKICPKLHKCFFKHWWTLTQRWW